MRNKPGLSIIIAGNDAFPELVSEIHWNGDLVAIVRKDELSGNYFLDCLPPEKTVGRFYGSMPLEEFIFALEDSKKALE